MKAKLNYMSRKWYLKKDISLTEMSFLIFISLQECFFRLGIFSVQVQAIR